MIDTFALVTLWSSLIAEGSRWIATVTRATQRKTEFKLKRSLSEIKISEQKKFIVTLLT